jgi:hypothetical protein
MRSNWQAQGDFSMWLVVEHPPIKLASKSAKNTPPKRRNKQNGNHTGRNMIFNKVKKADMVLILSNF